MSADLVFTRAPETSESSYNGPKLRYFHSAQPFCSTVRLIKTAQSQILQMTSRDAHASTSGCAVLLLAGVTDHGQMRDRHVTALGGVFIHAVLFHLRLRVFLHPVGCGI